eukprot:9471937-Pyramimonas_sp.AAC.2
MAVTCVGACRVARVASICMEDVHSSLPWRLKAGGVGGCWCGRGRGALVRNKLSYSATQDRQSESNNSKYATIPKAYALNTQARTV